MIKLPAYFTRFNRKADRSCNVTFETQEINSEQLKELDEHYQQFGWLLFSENDFDGNEVPEEDAPTDEVSPSKRLYNTLFVWHKQLSDKKKETRSFVEFRRAYMEKQIDDIKEKLT